MNSSSLQGDAFRALHEAGTFVLPAAWDGGSVRLLERLGHPAIEVSREALLMLYGTAASFGELLAAASSSAVPITADLGRLRAADNSEHQVEQLAEHGVVGVSMQCDDIAVGAAFVARAHARNLLVTMRLPTLTGIEADEALELLVAHRDAGADVLEVAGLRTREQLAEMIAAIDRPLSLRIGQGGAPPSVDYMRDLGVRRIATGTTLLRRALGAFLSAAKEIRKPGTFEYLVDAVDEDILRELLGT